MNKRSIIVSAFSDNKYGFMAPVLPGASYFYCS